MRSLLALPLVLAPTLAAAQLSEGYNFLKAVKEADGAKVTEMIGRPGSTMLTARDPSTGETALHITVARRDDVWTRFMLGRGANVNARDASGQTPLLVAVGRRWLEGAQLLLSQGAQVDAANAGGETPLIRAVQLGDVTMTRALLAAGANPRRTDNTAGLSALDYATRDPRLAPILRELQTPAAKPAREVQGPR